MDITNKLNASREEVNNSVNDSDNLLSGGVVFDQVLELGAQSTVVDVNANRFKVNTGSEVELLYLWEPSGTLPSSPFTITNITSNITGGFDFNINGSDYEFINIVNHELRSEMPSKLSGWGFVVDDMSEASNNSTRLLAASTYAYEQGTTVYLPFGRKYLESTQFDFPMTIAANHTAWGANRGFSGGTTDCIHIGGGVLFDFIPVLRASKSIDGCALEGLSIFGNSTARSAFRVSDDSVLGDELYARRLTKLTDVNISGYKGGYGYEVFWSFSNFFTRVNVVECASPVNLQKTNANAHMGCVYEQSPWGILSIDTQGDCYTGCTIEGIQSSRVGFTAPPDYPIWSAFSSNPDDYRGMAVRALGSGVDLVGCSFEANDYHWHTELDGNINVNGGYTNDGNSISALLMDAGFFYQKNTRIAGNTSDDRWAAGPVGAGRRAAITNNEYRGGADRPTTVPDICPRMEFDVFVDSSSLEYERVLLGLNFQVGGFQENGGVPKTLGSESLNTRASLLTSSSSNRAVNISSLPRVTGFLRCPQSNGTTLTLNYTDTSEVNDGEYLTIVFESGSLTNNLDFGSEFRTSGAPFSVATNSRLIVEFRLIGTVWYQSNTPVEV